MATTTEITRTARIAVLEVETVGTLRAAIELGAEICYAEQDDAGIDEATQHIKGHHAPHAYYFIAADGESAYMGTV
jgi:hypothetical protein